MRFVIITGMSGAGKSQAIRSMEDFGYYCIDNIPPIFIPKLAELCYSSGGKLNRVAIVSDIRGGELFSQLFESLNELEAHGYSYEILFLDASDSALIKRYKESRRMHPLNGEMEGRLKDAVARERRLLAEVRSRANSLIDTTDMSQKQLRAELSAIFASDDCSKMNINILSFGFKYGIPIDADMVFDVRFLPNPFYIPELKRHTGKESCVADYVLSFEQSKKFLQMLQEMMDFLMPQFVEEGKRHLVIAIGCTGGKHRSVTFAEALFQHLQPDYMVNVIHRDVQKNV